MLKWPTRWVTSMGCLWPLVARRRVVPNAFSFFRRAWFALAYKIFNHVALDVFQAVLNIICRFLDRVELSGDAAKSFRCVGGEWFAPHLPFCFWKGDCHKFCKKLQTVIGFCKKKEQMRVSSERLVFLSKMHQIIPQSVFTLKGFSRSICKALSKAVAPVFAVALARYHCNLKYLVTLTLKNTS